MQTTLKGTRFQSLEDIIDRRRSYGAFLDSRRSNSRGVSRSGRRAGKSVWTAKVIILKEIK
ncbi:unnamed protein product [Clavelina lepadiformis]|uniref:Uncharacterized protein n=1 Tax=Clavelina lepadiformis TaxID=159417 RepID=A0ABP0F8L0_CLALP